MADVSIDDVNSALSSLITTPEVDYRIGDKEERAGQKFSQLLALRKELMLRPVANIKIMTFDANDIDEHGTNENVRML